MQKWASFRCLSPPPTGPQDDDDEQQHPGSGGKFFYETIQVTADKQGLLAPEYVNAERDKIMAVTSRFTPTRYWAGCSRCHHGNITSVFGSRRSYEGGVFNSYHEGVDFWRDRRAGICRGGRIVVLAEPLTVRGNAVMIDHGWGVYTGYYHLSQIDVRVARRCSRDR